MTHCVNNTQYAQCRVITQTLHVSVLPRSGRAPAAGRERVGSAPLPFLSPGLPTLLTSHPAAPALSGGKKSSEESRGPWEGRPPTGPETALVPASLTLVWCPTGVQASWPCHHHPWGSGWFQRNPHTPPAPQATGHGLLPSDS